MVGEPHMGRIVLLSIKCPVCLWTVLKGTGQMAAGDVGVEGGGVPVVAMLELNGTEPTREVLLTHVLE